MNSLKFLFKQIFYELNETENDISLGSVLATDENNNNQTEIFKRNLNKLTDEELIEYVDEPLNQFVPFISHTKNNSTQDPIYVSRYGHLFSLNKKQDDMIYLQTVTHGGRLELSDEEIALKLTNDSY
ncbi:hypothetical protein SNEBB_007665 [Seison nebaliae]|nr:hypothetical protein SNEBB_007665 [Seison nebaliae]